MRLRATPTVSRSITRKPGFAPFFDQETNHTVILQCLRAIERRTAIGVGGVQVRAEFDRQLDCLERQSFAVFRLGFGPGFPRE